MRNKQLQIKQLDKKLNTWRNIEIQKPVKGWINLIRKVLGMSSYQLAKRVGVNQARVIQAEKAELMGALKLQTLEKFAEALDCRVVYCFVPNTSLENIIEKQAKKIAKKRVMRVSNSMNLESQGVCEDILQQQIEEQTEELLRSPLKNLWNADDEV